MLNKFQDQDLMASIELLEDALKGIHNAETNDTNLPNAIVLIRIAIDKIKNLHPSLFSYPKSAKYMKARFHPSIMGKNDADT